jgi:RNA polymerase sigma-70 factor (ECF subfamily)
MESLGSMALSDKELVKRCQADQAAFEELMQRYKKAVFAYARATTGSSQDAEEVTQDVFVKIYRAAHRFDAHYSFTTWLYKITSNTCKNKLRGHRRPMMSLDNEESPVVVIGSDVNPLDAYSRKVEIAEVRTAIGELPPRYRQVLYLRYVESLSYRAIAEALGLSIGNVEARIFRGKERVRRILLKKLTESGRPARAEA